VCASCWIIWAAVPFEGINRGTAAAVLLYVLLAIVAGVWNEPVFLAVNGAHNGLLDFVFGIASGLGDGLIVALACTCVMLFRLHLGGAALAAFAVSGLFVQLLKRIFDMPRPPAVLENVHLLGDMLTSHSFPSGHAASAGVMMLLAFLIWKTDKWQAWAVSGLFFLAAYGRIYGGVHFPLDVVAGLGIGMACMWGFWQWSKRWPVQKWEASPWAWKTPGLMLVLEADVLAVGYHVQPATAQPLAVILPLAALAVLVIVWKRRLVHG